MIKIIFDVPAENGGAMSILNQYYKYAIQDKENKYIFILSTPHLEQVNNVTVKNYPWIKKSWFHRLFFDIFIARIIVKKSDATELLSLQNMRIPGVRIKQTVYLHQALPFIKKKYSFFENKKLWVYQNIIGKLIKTSIKKADKIIVQSEWLKNIILNDQIVIDERRISIEKPNINDSYLKQFDYKKEENFSSFFYPSSAEDYKNHEVLINAATDLVKKKEKTFLIFFTINKQELKVDLQRKIEENSLPIVFLGNLTSNEVFLYYSKSVLVYPSILESFGLPLLESSLCNCVILAANEFYAKEILEEYKNKYLFDYNDFLSLSNLMANQINNGHKNYIKEKE